MDRVEKDGGFSWCEDSIGLMIRKADSSDRYDFSVDYMFFRADKGVERSCVSAWLLVQAVN